MAFAIDLNERQSTRTLEQAIRHQAAIRLFPRTWEDERCLICHLAGEEEHSRSSRENLLLSAPTSSLIPFQATLGSGTAPLPEDLEQEDAAPEGAVADDERQDVPALEVTAEEFTRLRGVYCDAQLLLGENRYLFCSDVVGVEPPDEGMALWRVILYRPSTIQVMQRRRYWRFRPARSSRVEMRWIDEYGHKGMGIGWLCNISPDGMACRTDAQFSDHIYIGMNLTVTFKLDPASDETYTLACDVCNKMPAGTNGKFVIGMQFAHSPAAGPIQEAVERLRRHLLEMKTADRPAPKGADR